MKIVNEKGKLFGIINIIDLAVVLVILLVAVVFGSKALNKNLGPITTNDNTKEIFVTHKSTAHNEAIAASAFKKGDRLVSLTNEVDAWVESVSYEPAPDAIEMDNGTVIYAKDPVKKQVTVVFKMKTSAGSPIIKLGTQDVAVGKLFTLKTKTAEYSGYIEKIEYK